MTPLKNLIKIIGFFACIFGSIILFRTIGKIGFSIEQATNVFVFLGLICGGLLFAFVPQCRFLNLYVFGHELTHWIVAKLMFKDTGGLSSIKFTSSGGYVMIYNPNFIITLAPYFIPFYTLCIAFIYFLVQAISRNQCPLIVQQLFLFFMGIAYAYHLFMTFMAIGYGQKDLQQVGVLFSLSFICFCNFFFVFLTQFIIDYFPWHYWTWLFEEFIAEMRWILSLIQHSF